MFPRLKDKCLLQSRPPTHEPKFHLSTRRHSTTRMPPPKRSARRVRNRERPMPVPQHRRHRRRARGRGAETTRRIIQDREENQAQRGMQQAIL